jgi:carbonic anhydrase
VSAALEFGITALKIRHIVVLGHARCGGVRAFAEKAAPLSPGDFIGNWMRLMTPAVAKAGPQDGLSWPDYLTRLEQANVANSLDNLKTFPPPAKTDRARPSRDPRRLFRRRHGAALGARRRNRRVRTSRDRRSGAALRAAAPVIR